MQKKIQKLRRGYCKKEGTEIIIKAEYNVIEDGKQELYKLDNNSFNRCVECDYLNKCKLFKEI